MSTGLLLCLSAKTERLSLKWALVAYLSYSSFKKEKKRERESEREKTSKYNINIHKFVIEHCAHPQPPNRHTHACTHACAHTCSHLLEAGWKQLEVLGIREREKVSVEFTQSPVCDVPTGWSWSGDWHLWTFCRGNKVCKVITQRIFQM